MLKINFITTNPKCSSYCNETKALSALNNRKCAVGLSTTLKLRQLYYFISFLIIELACD